MNSIPTVLADLTIAFSCEKLKLLFSTIPQKSRQRNKKVKRFAQGHISTNVFVP